jgi:hypothetical protein
MRSASILGSGLLPLLCAAVPAQVVFQPPQVVPLPVTGVFLTNPVLGDLDGDGDLDAIVTTGAGAGGFLQRFLNDGDGNFAPMQVIQGFAGPMGAALHDMNGDGRPDYVLAFSSMTIVLWGDGAGGFLGNTSVGSNSSPQRVVVGLMNGDAIPDIVVTTAGATIFGIPARLQVFLGNGSSFALAGSLELANDAQDVDLADVDGDGVLDVIAAVAGVAYVHPGDGSGGLAAGVALAGTVTATRLVAGDVDQDGDVDLVLGSLAPQVQVLLNDGTGQFAPGTLFNAGTFGAEPALGDMDGDGLVDIVLSDSGAAFVQQLIVLRGLGGGGFEEDVHVTAGAQVAGGPLLIADLDGDGRPDVLTGTGGLARFLNRTYAPGSPFFDLGHALPGTHGYPVQIAEGSLLGDTPYAFRLLNGLPNMPATIVLGFSELNLPHKGGVMVPSPDLLFFGNPMDAQGAFTIAGLWPAGLPSGVSLYLQWWFTDTGAPTNRGASSGLRFTTP